jgi:predicted peptidase
VKLARALLVLIVGACSLLSASRAAGAHSEPELVVLFTPHEFQCTSGRYRDQMFYYRLYDPRPAERYARPDDGQRFPMIVWLHGFGEQGKDNVAQLRWVDRIMPPPWERERFPFFVLAVQCPADGRSWCPNPAAKGESETACQESQQDGAAANKTLDTPGEHEDMLSVLGTILDDVLERYPIDRDHVSLSGISAAGRGCWIFASRRPDLFSAVAPLSGPAFDATSEQIAALRQMPIWVFHCKPDEVIPIGPVRESVERLAKAGVNVHLTEMEYGAHDAADPAFKDFELREWLLTQRRGEAPSQIITAKWEIVYSIRAFFRMPYEFARDIIHRWSWIQLTLVAYFTVVAGVVARYVVRRVRIVRRKTPRTPGRTEPGTSPTLEAPIANVSASKQ